MVGPKDACSGAKGRGQEGGGNLVAESVACDSGEEAGGGDCAQGGG